MSTYKGDYIKTSIVNDMATKLRNIEELEEFLDDHDIEYKNFGNLIRKFVAEKELDENDWYNDLVVTDTLSESHLKSLINGNRVPVNRVHVLAIGIALELSIEEMNTLLAEARQRKLDSGRSKGDAVIIYGLEQLYPYSEINDMLIQYDCEYVLYKKGKD